VFFVIFEGLNDILKRRQIVSFRTRILYLIKSVRNTLIEKNKYYYTSISERTNEAYPEQKLFLGFHFYKQKFTRLVEKWRCECEYSILKTHPHPTLSILWFLSWSLKETFSSHGTKCGSIRFHFSLPVPILVRKKLQNLGAGMDLRSNFPATSGVYLQDFKYFFLYIILSAQWIKVREHNIIRFN